jgi:hypothetical protein
LSIAVAPQAAKNTSEAKAAGKRVSYAEFHSQGWISLRRGTILGTARQICP